MAAVTPSKAGNLMTILSPGTAGPLALPVPEVPAREQRPGGGPVAFTSGHHFAVTGEAGPAAPLSVKLL